MKSDLYTKQVRRALVVAAACAACAAIAGEPEQQDSTTPEPAKVASATQANTSTASGAVGRAYPPMQKGVRQAAEQGPEALRRYISRTRMIYNYYFWDFAKQE
jgi:hypothetical protein